VRLLIEKYPGIFEEVVSITTRKIRGNEIKGVDYHFCSKEEFQQVVFVPKKD
jgi:guanylate kinase